MRAADVAGGALSILTGVAANKSMRTGRPVRIDSLVKRIPPVSMTPMKEWSISKDSGVKNYIPSPSGEG